MKNFVSLITAIILVSFAVEISLANPEERTEEMQTQIYSCKSEENLFTRISCFSRLASEHKDVTICDQARPEGVKYQCYAIFAERNNDPEVCKEIPAKTKEHQELQDVCFSDVAKLRKDHTLCNQIKTQGLKDSCLYGVYKKTGEKGLCNMIQDIVLKSSCSGNPKYIK